MAPPRKAVVAARVATTDRRSNGVSAREAIASSETAASVACSSRTSQRLRRVSTEIALTWISVRIHVEVK